MKALEDRMFGVKKIYRSIPSRVSKWEEYCKVSIPVWSVRRGRGFGGYRIFVATTRATLSLSLFISLCLQ